MPLLHGVVQGDVDLVLHRLQGDGVVFVGGLGLQWGQGEAAAAEHRRPGAVDDVAADGADVPLGPEQVAGAVGVGDAVPGEQLHDGDVQGLGQGLDEGNVGVAFGGLPLGDGFVADLEPDSKVYS